MGNSVDFKSLCIELRQRLTTTEQRNAELERDAARYRYLRDPDNRDGLEPEDVIVVGIAEGEDIVWLEQMDQAVDVMMESTKPTESGASEPQCCARFPKCVCHEGADGL